MSPEQNKTQYLRFVEEVLNAGDAEAAANFFEPTFVDHSLPPGVPATLEGFRGWFRMFYAAFPDAHWNVEYITAVGDVVAQHKTMAGTHRGDYLGVPATGKRITAQETGIARFRDGKMVEYWGTFDDFGLARQLGLLPEGEAVGS